MEFLFIIALFTIAYLYASIGHGGASGYISLMVIFGIMPEFIKVSALTMNVFVSLIAFVSFFRAGHFRWQLIWPFLILSIPSAFIGAQLKVSTTLFNSILLVFLVIASVRLLINTKENEGKLREINIPVFLLLGSVLGFFSGIAGIGGGIILTPILVLFRWATIKQAAAVSALFILVNSLSGILSIGMVGIHFPSGFVIWLVVAILGGLLGAYLGSFKLNTRALKYFLTAILLVACIKLFI